MSTTLTSSTTNDLVPNVPDRLSINGQWVDATDRATLTVIDPATGEDLATIADAGPTDAMRALDAAVAAAPAWAATPPGSAPRSCARHST